MQRKNCSEAKGRSISSGGDKMRVVGGGIWE